MSAPLVPKPFTHTPPEVEIIAVPDGEAPEWVRQAWVGMILPLATPDTHRMEVVGVVSGARNWMSLWFARLTRRTVVQSGYLVETLRAVDSLSRQNRDAAEWWRQNTPHLLEPQRILLFEAHVCRPVTRPPPEPANR